MTEEAISINGVPQSDFTEIWNAAGRRTRLAQVGAGTGGSVTYAYRADGLMSSVTQGGQSFNFAYGDNGLLLSRSNAWRPLTVGQRDGLGRILWQTNIVGAALASVEGMTYRANSTLASYVATRTGTGAWNDDGRYYGYNSRDQLVSEPMDIGNGSMATNSYSFDANKLGVLTAAQWSGALTNGWQATSLSGWSQITAESWKQCGLTLRASGSAVNASSVTTTLDGNPLGSTFANGRWYADTNLSVGNHTVAATANYNVGQYSATATSTFSVAGTNGVTNYFDLAGNVTNRIFASGKAQSLTWDGFGRLVGVVQREGSGNGFNWSAVYDGFGRRLRTVNTPVVTNLVNSLMTLTIDSYYDPLVEFEEVGVSVNGQRTWKVLGPDLSGVYGGMQGVGGLEATIREGGSQTNGVLNDCFGNVLATISGTSVNWSPVRVGGYGPALGYQAPSLSLGTPLAETELWRSRRVDPSGFYYLGARYYDPVAGHFLSADPLGHATSMDLYSAFYGDSINYFDADGRFGKTLRDRSWQLRDSGGVVDAFKAMPYGFAGAILMGIGSTPAVFGLAGDAMSEAGQEIGSYTGGTAILARTLLFSGRVGFGNTSLLFDPVHTAPAMVKGAVLSPINLARDTYGLATDPSVNGAFDFFEEGLGTLALLRGGAMVHPRLNIANYSVGSRLFAGVPSLRYMGRYPEWTPGNPITQTTPEGNYPSWPIIRSRYWQNRIQADPGAFGDANRAIMERGFAPKAQVIVRDRATGQVYQKLVEKEIHHAWGNPGVPGFDEPISLREVWPWEHETLLPPGRRLDYDFIRFY